MGEHAERLQHLAMLAGAGQVAAFQHRVNIAGELVDRLFQPAPLQLEVFGDQLGDDDARLVQHHVAERHAFGNHHALEDDILLALSLGGPSRSTVSPAEAIISASTMAVVCSASTSSSL